MIYESCLFYLILMLLYANFVRVRDVVTMVILTTWPTVMM
jgi:hypothetical protein